MTDVLLPIAVLAVVVLLGVKLVTDRRNKAAVAAAAYSPQRQSELALEVRSKMSDVEVGHTIVDTYGRTAIVLPTSADRLVVFRKQWPADEEETEVQHASEIRVVPAAEIIGAAVGETGSRKTDKKGKVTLFADTVELRLLFDDTDDPLVVVDFLPGQVDAEGRPHLAARKAAGQWEARARVLAFRGQKAQTQGQMLAMAARKR